jgi:pyruvate kinase
MTRTYPPRTKTIVINVKISAWHNVDIGLTHLIDHSSVVTEVSSEKTKTKTKIVCTIGPSTHSEDMLMRLIEAGMNVARLNLSHGPLAEQIASLHRIRRVATRAGAAIGILADLPGPRIRVGQLSPDPAILREGSAVTLTARRVIGNPRLVCVSHPSVLRELKKRDPIFLADGTIRLTVERVADDEAICRVDRGGTLFSGKGVNLPGKRLRLRALTAKDVTLLRSALKNRVDFIGLSFTTDRSDVIRAKRIIKQSRRRAWVVAKIEKREAVENLRQIVQEADAIMIARGDLGVEMGIDEIPLLQKRIVRVANAAGKLVITATQMLESMVSSPTPTRAEVTDIANAIIDGTDAVMLSEETAVGSYPVEAVRVMRRVTVATERSLPYRSLLESRRTLVEKVVQEAISFSACDVARLLETSCIVAHTRTGLTAHRVSKFRPSVPVIALTYSTPVMNRLSLLWGVYPHRVKRLGTTAEIFGTAKIVARTSGIARKGNRVVVVCGDPSSPNGTTDLLRVQTG